MKKRYFVRIVLAMAFVITIGRIAEAGLRAIQPVVASPTNRFGLGMLGSAYNSTDNTQFILCGVNTAANSKSMTCTAKDSTGVTVMCTTSNSNLINAVNGLPDSGYLTFNFDANGNCTSIRVEYASYSQPH